MKLSSLSGLPGPSIAFIDLVTNFVSDPKIDLAMILIDSADDEDSLWYTTSQRIQQVHDSNIQCFIRLNPEKFP